MNRESLLQTLKEQLGNVNIAVEVGVWRGDYSRSIIKNLQPSVFYGVDPYEIYEGYTDKPNVIEFQDQANLDKLHARVTKTFNTFNNKLGHTNSILVRELGTNYASQHPDQSLDFVYLDSDHKYQSVKSEIEAWYPKVKDNYNFKVLRYASTKVSKKLGYRMGNPFSPHLIKKLLKEN